MKIILFSASMLCSLISMAQNSYYFSEPLPSLSAKVQQISSNYHGEFSNSEGTIRYLVNEEGISIISTSVTSIPKETVRETSKYEVRNGHIFGVTQDSLPCVLDDGRYFFGVRNRDIYVGEGSPNILTKLESNRYLINQYEEGRYIPILIEFKGKKLTLKYFDYEGTEGEFAFITNQEALKASNQDLVILSPTADEFTQLQNKGFFVDPLVLKLN